jgi:hypothetical protein
MLAFDNESEFWREEARCKEKLRTHMNPDNARKRRLCANSMNVVLIPSQDIGKNGPEMRNLAESAVLIP